MDSQLQVKLSTDTVLCLHLMHKYLSEFSQACEMCVQAGCKEYKG